MYVFTGNKTGWSVNLTIDRRPRADAKNVERCCTALRHVRYLSAGETLQDSIKTLRSSISNTFNSTSIIL
jgi:hypothetical protein